MTSNSEFYFHVLREGDILGIDEFFLIAVLSLIIGIFSIFLGLLVIKTKVMIKEIRFLLQSSCLKDLALLVGNGVGHFLIKNG